MLLAGGDMADNDEMMGEDSLAEESSSKKGGFAGALLPMLKWIIIGVAVLILIVVVVIVTMKIANGNKAAATTVAVSEEYTGQRELLDWYASLDGTQVITAVDTLQQLMPTMPRHSALLL